MYSVCVHYDKSHVRRGILFVFALCQHRSSSSSSSSWRCASHRLRFIYILVGLPVWLAYCVCVHALTRLGIAIHIHTHAALGHRANGPRMCRDRLRTPDTGCERMVFVHYRIMLPVYVPNVPVRLQVKSSAVQSSLPSSTWRSRRSALETMRQTNRIISITAESTQF